MEHLRKKNLSAQERRRLTREMRPGHFKDYLGDAEPQKLLSKFVPYPDTEKLIQQFEYFYGQVSPEANL